MALHTEIRLHDHPACAIRLGAGGLLGDHLAQRAGLYACGPHLAGALDPALGAVLVLHGHALIVDVRHHRVELDFDAHLLQPALRNQSQLLAHRGQHRPGSLEQDHSAFARLDRAERAGQRAIGEFGDLARQLDTRRPGADDHEGEPAFALGMVGGHLSGLERTENAAAELEGIVDGFHARGECRELVVAEVGLLRPGRHDQAVEMRHRGHRHQLGGDGLRLQVNRFDLTEKHLNVLLLAQHKAGGRGDLAFGQNARRHLVEQRLEQVGGRPRDQGDVDVGSFERLRRGQAPEAGTDDDDVVAFGRHRRHAHSHSSLLDRE